MTIVFGSQEASLILEQDRKIARQIHEAREELVHLGMSPAEAISELRAEVDDLRASINERETRIKDIERWQRLARE